MDTETRLDLLFSGKPLDLNQHGDKPLKEYHFQNMDSLNYSQKMHGGGSNLEPLEGHVRLTKDPCCVMSDDNPREWRAKLACGHAIGQSSFALFDLISSLSSD